MIDAIIWYITSFGCAVLFYCIGVFAAKREKPMWFWSGTEVKDYEILDVKKYNKENGIMWKLYSCWFIAAGVSRAFSPYVAIAFFVFGFTVGMVILVLSYNRIYKKYKVK